MSTIYVYLPKVTNRSNNCLHIDVAAYGINNTSFRAGSARRFAWEQTLIYIGTYLPTQKQTKVHGVQ